MIEIIREMRQVTRVRYELRWDSISMYGGGYSFPCNEHGMLLAHNEFSDELMTRLAMDNYKRMFNHPDFTFVGVIRLVDRWMEPRVGRCICGAEVVLNDFTNTCDECWRDYNVSGQLLAPRSQWGEETGEHPADVARFSWYNLEDSDYDY